MAMPLLSKVEGDAGLPDKVDVVIIGGGIIGVSTALELAERGVRVAVCEKGEIGAEQSSRNWGWVRRMGRDPAEVPIAMESQRLWRDLSARIGEDVGYREPGILYAAANPKEMNVHETWAEKTKGFGLDSRLLSAKEMADLVPHTGRTFAGGLLTPSDGRAEPLQAAPAIARAARKLGAAIITNCAVRGVETLAGRVCSVVTERGAIKCDTAVLAGGAWTRLFAGNLGVNFSQLHVRATVARIEHGGPVPEFAVGGTDFAFRKREDGGYTVAVRNGNIVPLAIDNFKLFFEYKANFLAARHDLQLRFGKHFFTDLRIPRHWELDKQSPFETCRINDTAPIEQLDVKALKNVISAFPAFAGARITHGWSGVIDVTPSGLPVIDHVSALPGLFIASGFSGHGFGIGPGVGRLAAEMVTGAAPCVDVTPFRLIKTPL